MVFFAFMFFSILIVFTPIGQKLYEKVWDGFFSLLDRLFDIKDPKIKWPAYIMGLIIVLVFAYAPFIVWFYLIHD